LSDVLEKVFKLLNIFFQEKKKQIYMFVLYFTLYFFILLNGELWFADIT